MQKNAPPYWANFWAGPLFCFAHGGQNDPQSSCFGPNFLSQKNPHDPRIILSHSPEEVCGITLE